MGLNRTHLHQTCYSKNINENLALKNAFQNVNFFWLPSIKFIKHLQEKRIETLLYTILGMLSITNQEHYLTKDKCIENDRLNFLVSMR